jgi:secreted trypsin-like serine protease
MGRRVGTIGAAAALLLGLTALTTPVDAIVGGRDAAPGEGAFTVALLDADGSQFCGGSVVAPGWVLTAGHCGRAVIDRAVPGPITVAIGRPRLSDTSAGGAHAVAQVLVHPAFGATTLVNDAALLKLATPTAVPPIRLAGPADDNLEADGTPARVYGWGLILPQLPLLPGVPPGADPLQVVDVPIVGDGECQAQYVPLLEVLGQPHFEPSVEVCAAALLKDSCFGDSGGPLVAQSSSGAVQIGIVSTGVGCAIPTHAGIYAEVNAASIHDWITATIA